MRGLLSGIRGVATAPPPGLVTVKWTSGALLGNGDTLSSPQLAGEPDAIYRVEQDILDAQVLTTTRLGEATVAMRS